MKVSTQFRMVSLVFSAHNFDCLAVPYDEQVALAQSGFVPANAYYPIPVHSPPWVHPSPPSDTTPPPSNSPGTTLAHYAGALPSPSPTESLANNALMDARSQDVSEEGSSSSPTVQSPPTTTRNHQGTGRRPGACSRCKKLKV